MKTVASVVAVALGVVSAAPAEQKSGNFCVISWDPPLCGTVSQGCVGWTQFQTVEACGYADASAAADFYCVTNWSPKLCDLVSAGNCVSTGRYLTLSDCGGDDASVAPADGFCVTNWFPKTCEVISAGNCVGWYPYGGYATIEQCGPDSAPTGDICTVNWYPWLCGSSGANECVGVDRFDTVAACGGADVDSFSANGGFCVTQWWAENCEADGSCVQCASVGDGSACVGWYPPGGFATQDACLGVGGSAAKKSEKSLQDIKEEVEKNIRTEMDRYVAKKLMTGKPRTPGPRIGA